MNRREFVKMVGGVFASVAALSPFLKSRRQEVSSESPFPGFQRQEVSPSSPAAGWYHNNSDHSMAFVKSDDAGVTLFTLPPGHSVIVDYDEDGKPTFNGLNYFLWEAEHEQA